MGERGEQRDQQLTHAATCHRVMKDRECRQEGEGGGQGEGFPLANAYVGNTWCLRYAMDPLPALSSPPTISFGHRASFQQRLPLQAWEGKWGFGKCQLCVFLGDHLIAVCAFPGIASSICRSFEAPILVR